MWKGLQEFFFSAWCWPVYEDWLRAALAGGKIKLLTPVGKPLPVTKIEKFRQVTFTGRAWAWIDPQAEVSANKEAIAARLKSRAQVIREMGGDPEDVWAEIQREEQTLKTLGIPAIEDKANQTPQDPRREDA